MSELLQTSGTPHDLKRRLFATASAMSLLGVGTVAHAAGDLASARPTLWVEIGGQFDVEEKSAQTWTPPNAPQPIVQPAFEPLGRMPDIGYDWNGKIAIQPVSSDWVFSASVQFGKAKRGPKSTHDQANVTGYNLFGLPAPPTYAFTDSHTVSDTRHFVIDFQAGRDVGLGLFGKHSTSIVNVGIRMAQLTESAQGTMTAQVSAPNKYNAGINRYADIHAERSFSGVGPSIDWNGAVQLFGSSEDSLDLNWGAQVALLFGRQKANVALHTKEVQFTTPFTGSAASYLRTHSTSISVRRKTAIVPNVSGFAGVSYNLGSRGKISLGYRADFFFGAIDGGLVTRRSETRGFYGPFASVGFGLGD